MKLSDSPCAAGEPLEEGAPTPGAAQEAGSGARPFPSVEGGVSLGREGSDTSDTFLAEVGRIPQRRGSFGALPAPGDALGHFVLRAGSGRGGMGVVYAAEDTALGREVALKVLPLRDDDAAHRRRFLREARSAAALSDPAIATVYEVGEASGWMFIAMERVHGVTLRARLDARPRGDRGLGAPEALRIGREIARALAQAHARGVIHRDLKPDNVMIAEDGRIKLLDFGLAQLAPAAHPGPLTSGSAEGRVVGTPLYMSPEQAKARPLDARSDVFAFGVLLHELLTGKRPFGGATLVELFIAIDRDEPAPPSRDDPRVPPALDRVVARCLRKAPAARYADGAELSRALDAVAGPRALRPWAIAGALAAAAGLALVAFGASRAGGGDRAPNAAPPPAPPAPAPASARPVPALAAPAPTRITDLPAPASASPDAVAAYRAGLSAFRAGQEAWPALVRATELDPTLAPAHLQIAAEAMVTFPGSARGFFRRAGEHRDALSERDRELLDAIEPVVQRQPADWREANRRLRALAEQRFPGDAQIWFLLGCGMANYDDMHGAIRAMERSIALDPGFAAALGAVASYESYLGRFDDAERSIERCLDVSPGSLFCLINRIRLRSREGACDALEQDARRMIAAGAEPVIAYTFLADALAARGRPITAVREALRQGEAAIAALPATTGLDGTKGFFRESFVRADLLAGDFEAAERGARAMDRDAAPSRRQIDHGLTARLLAQLLEERGRAPEAGRVAVEFLDRRDAWEPEPSAEDIALGADATPPLLLAALRGGALPWTELASRRDAWRRAWEARITPVSRSFLWLHAYGATAASPEDAREALAALPQYEPLPPFRPGTLVDAAVGHTFLLAGRTEEALSWLTAATQSCEALIYPVEHTQAHHWLGQAREASGDPEGACAAYGVVLDRWGRARPRSVTAEAARERVLSLRCAPDP